MHHASVFFLHDDFLYASYLATLTFVFNDVTLRDAAHCSETRQNVQKEPKIQRHGFD